MADVSRGITRLRTPGLLATLALLLGAIATIAAGASEAAASTSAEPDPAGLQWSATVNDRSVSSIDTNQPLVLDSDRQTLVVLDLTNTGPDPIKVRAIRLEGRVIGMTFFRYTTRLDIELAAGTSTQRRFELDLDDLSGEAVGLIPAELLLLDDDRQTLRDEAFPVDVKGSLASVYGIFGLAVAGITVVLLVSLLVAIARRRLSRNRWKRGLTFLAVGVGLGLTLTFTLSATRQLSPSAGAWLTLVAVFGLAGFAVGYLLPLGAKPPPERDDEPEADQFAGEYADAGNHAATTKDQVS